MSVICKLAPQRKAHPTMARTELTFKYFATNVSMLLGFLEAMLAYSADNNGDALDKHYNIGTSLSSRLRQESVRICSEFQGLAGELLENCNMYLVGKDLWLGRATFPYGFPIDEYPKNSQTLEALARSISGFSEVYVNGDLIFPVEKTKI